MAQKERLEQIRQIMQKERKISVSELSVQLAVTPETIRRDLEKLEQESFLTRTHGGAVITQADLSEKISFLKRENTNAEAKCVIAGLAADRIPFGASIGCDASSTSMELLEKLKNREDLLVLTNSAKAICDMAGSRYGLLSTGGYINRQSYSLQGGAAKNMVQEYHLEMVFMSCKGISKDGGIFDSHEVEIEMKKSLLDRSLIALIRPEQETTLLPDLSVAFWKASL
jgi:DeoR/GlpR family transcriptional regulator of sugar metabolism